MFQQRVKFAGWFSVVAGWLIIAAYAAVAVATYAKLPGVEKIAVSIDPVAAIFTIAIGVAYVFFGNQVRRMKTVHLKNDIQLLFYGSLVLAVLTIVGGSLPGLVLVLLIVSLGFAGNAVDELMKEEGFRSNLKEDLLWLHRFFYRLNDLAHKRTPLQAVGFYFSYIVLMLGVGALLLGLGELWVYFVKTPVISLETNVSMIASAVYLLGIAYLSWRILKAKNLWPESAYVVIWVFDILMTLFLGGLFGLIVPAYLTTLPKRHKTEEA